MIIVKLMGGLGNQMFQYAAGRNLACRLETSLKLDTSFLESVQAGSTPRRYELDCFNITAERAGLDDVVAVLGKKRFYSEVRNKIGKRLGLRWVQPHFYRETHYHYDEYFECLPDNTFLVGYWHSERYFAPISDLLAREFTYREPLTGRNLETAGLIERTNAVAVHVRRGDYVTDLKTNQFHGVCNLDYYRVAVAEMAGRARDPHFFVFSDEHAWVKDNLRFDHPTTFVDCNGSDRGYEDLRLMSLCRNNIIANSSFSWWGAWLNRNPAKIVIAPRKWFNSPGYNTSDLIPAKWMTL